MSRPAGAAAVAADTRRIAALFARRTGIDLERGSQGPALERFVLQRSRDLRLPSLDAYFDLLDAQESPELGRLINATTIGLSWLFRDAEQLAAIDALFEEAPDPERPLEIWVPGCARGEDVYSLAMLAAARGRRVSILGTDVNSDFLAHAAEGVYGAWSSRHVPTRLLHHLAEREGGRHVATPALRRSIRFARHNLLDPPPRLDGRRGFDIVLCRNVLIYFHAAEAEATVARLGQALHDDGWLFLGANEPWSPAQLRPVSLGGRVAFRPAGAAAPSSLPIEPPAPAPLLATAVELPPLPWPEEPPAGAEADSDASLPPAARALLRQAGDRHVEGRFAEALTLCSQVLAMAPLSDEAQLLVGVTHYMMGDFPAAVHALRAALFLEAKSWPAAFYLALSHERIGNLNEAARAYRDVVAAADGPQGLSAFSTVVLEQIGVWKPDIVQLARARAGRRR